MFLLTWHGTIIALERSTGTLVHLPLLPADLDAIDVKIVLPSRHLDRGLTSKAGALAGTSIEPAARLCTAHLRRDGRFLCAHAGHRALSFDRDEGHDWETFLLIEDRHRDILRELLGWSWRIEPDGTAVLGSAIECLPGFRLKFGAATLDLTTGLPEVAGRPHGNPEAPEPGTRLILPVPGRANLAVVSTAMDEAKLHKPEIAEVPAPPANATAAAPPLDEADALDPHKHAVLRGWALRQTAPWLRRPVRKADATNVYEELNQTNEWLHLFRFAANDVELVAKPPGEEPNASGAGRPQCYLQFFRAVAKLLPQQYEATICVGLGDLIPWSFEVPVFCFQKTENTNCLLLPDIDIIGNEFYEAPHYFDPLAYGDKARKAIFAGSTTGGRITEEIARSLATPRLRAARYFENSSNVTFRLPGVVQCESAEVEAMLRAHSFCQGSPIPLEEQFRFRFLLSLDGNGATCARVAIALHSNSTLLKYDSKQTLYYFSGMQPWLHYVPIIQDADVERMITLEGEHPAYFEQIAQNGRAFAQTYLTRDSVTRYMAMLLLQYQNCFSDGGVQASAQLARVARPGAPPVALGRPVPPRLSTKSHVVVHVQSQGDKFFRINEWAGERGSGAAIEGFAMSFTGQALRENITYQAVLRDGSLDEAVAAGAYCGTRGAETPIFGFCLNLSKEFSGRAKISYEASFVDGTNLGPIESGSVCKAKSGAALEALLIHLER